MASTTPGLLLLSIVLVISAFSAAARPCKTIFFITTTSTSPHPLPNPNNSPRLTFFVTEIREFRRSGSLTSSSDVVVSSEPYFSTFSHVKASISDRTMDIMSIVGAILFGVGCGALTAATMYLFWSLFAPRGFEFCSDSEESGDEEDDERRVNDDNNDDGYFAVPVAAKPVPPSADEVDQIAAMK